MICTIWRFEAMDSLFFRDGRPMNVGESAWVDSGFPPSGQSLQGAIRTAILEHSGVNIESFQQGKLGDLNKEIGDCNSLGNMSLTGGFLESQGKLVFPVPLDVVINDKHSFGLLKPLENGIESDLGGIQLPAISEAGYKPIGEKFIRSSALENILAGNIETLKKDHLFSMIAETRSEQNALCDREYKIGLARNNKTRTAKEGMLFAIAPLRPRDGIRIAVQVDGVRKSTQPKSGFVQKLGGEGKLARVEISDKPLAFPESPKMNRSDGKVRFKLVFTTPALMPLHGWLPANFKASTDRQILMRWCGALGECEVDIVSACIGKPVKIGGWNLALRRSEDLRAFIPAGSVYFCETTASPDRVKKLHGLKIGERTEYGYGHVLIGTW